jgi:hypothetical protein
MTNVDMLSVSEVPISEVRRKRYESAQELTLRPDDAEAIHRRKLPFKTIVDVAAADAKEWLARFARGSQMPNTAEILQIAKEYQVFVSAGSLLVGFVAKYWYDLHTLRRQRTLARTDEQIGRLYGPMFALSNASSKAWQEFRNLYRPGPIAYFDPSDPPNESELRAWRSWMQTVFMPMNIEMEKLILTCGELIDGPEFPRPFAQLLAHNATYKAVLAGWADGDFSRNTSSLNYPEELTQFVHNEFQRLRVLQQKFRRKSEHTTRASIQRPYRK